MSVRNVYLDCEFLPADPHTSGLVSIGLTDDQDVDYYAVNRDMDMLAVESVPWMVENVLPYLPAREERPGQFELEHYDEDVKPLERIRRDIAAYFADTDATETHLYAYYGGQDICRLHSLWDNDWSVMPDQIPRWFFDIKGLVVQAGRPELPAQDGSEHHALADAQYNRTMHRHLLALAKGN
ncbi:hypothetical protein ABZ829_28190 [Streptomyces xanthochromogenes]|uniref:hypothetical protein n=1 Tax=Streptomyces xanthochromogenes TaxID=67384 RepID=UPI00343E343C